MFTIVADLNRCEGYANCVMAAPEIFDLGDDGLVVMVQQVLEETDRASAHEAVLSCPVSALRIVGD